MAKPKDPEAQADAAASAAPVPAPEPVAAPIALLSSSTHLDAIIANASSEARRQEITPAKLQAFVEVARAVLPVLGNVTVPGGADILVISARKF